MVNNLAHRLSNEVLDNKEMNFLYTELVGLIHKDLVQIVDNFLRQKDLINKYTVDSAIYESIVFTKGLEKSIEGYTKTKGDFLSRVKKFSKAWLCNQVRLDIAEKTIHQLQTDNYDLLFESEKINPSCELFDSEDEESETVQTIEEFIANDKEGEVIRILIEVEGQKERNVAFTKFFGKYTATERKKVQRAKQRLQAHLLNIGVCI